MPTAVVIEPYFEGAASELTLGPGEQLTVGRSTDADVPVPFDDYLSNEHFSIACERSYGVIRDLDSRNGTFVNGTRAHCRQLRDGDRIMAGMSIFVVRVHADASEDTQVQPTVEWDAPFDSTSPAPTETLDWHASP